MVLVDTTLKAVVVPEQTVLFTGCVLITGNWPSSTVTVNVQVDVLPDASVATCVIVVTPSGKADPLAGPTVLTTVTPGQLSVAVAV